MGNFVWLREFSCSPIESEYFLGRTVTVFMTSLSPAPSLCRPVSLILSSKNQLSANVNKYIYSVMHGSGKVTKTEIYVIYWKNKVKYTSYLGKKPNIFLIKKITG